jgi:nucleoside-diphosphate-sugar epimerase
LGVVSGVQTILGAGGAIGAELLKELASQGLGVRLVGRSPKQAEGASEVVAADLSQLDQTITAVAGSEVAYLLVGLKYDVKVWRDLWPRIMRNTIEACKRAHARLMFFDNVYMYGRVKGPMTEDTPFNPCSRKGEIRAGIATTLLHEIKAGNLTAMIARSADFYGPGARTGVPNVLVFDKLARGKTASWLANDAVPHSLTFTPDAARSLALLADNEAAWNQTWHVPTGEDPPSGRQFIEMVAGEFGVPAKYRVLRRPMLKLAGLFDTTVRELNEMLYQDQYEYIFDSSKFVRAFSSKATPYAEGIRLTAATYR